jgi:isocitrate/isopropylmalate dehydrogenase
MGKRLIDAVHDCIASGEKTGDLGGTLNTMEFTQAVVRRATPTV